MWMKRRRELRPTQERGRRGARVLGCAPRAMGLRGGGGQEDTAALALVKDPPRPRGSSLERDRSWRPFRPEPQVPD